MSKPVLSVIIVDYQAAEHVSRLKKSFASDKKVEVIVVDAAAARQGYNASCNLGATRAQGEFLIFMNPDIYLNIDVCWSLVAILNTRSDVAVVGPQIQNRQGEVQITCSEIPHPWLGLGVYSFIHKLPGMGWLNYIYRLQNFNHLTSREVPVLSGAMVAMRKADYVRLGKFDEKYFLYWEEFDLAQRVLRELHQKSYFCAESQVQHVGGVSTEQNKRSQYYWQQSRRLWYRKWYGFYGLLVVYFLEWAEKWRKIHD